MQSKESYFGGIMSLSNRARGAVLGVGVALLSLSAVGQSLPPGVTPVMLSQLKSMSPAQQQALARQYGIALPDMVQRADSGPGLALPGQPLVSPTDQQYLEDYSYLPGDVDAEEDG